MPQAAPARVAEPAVEACALLAGPSMSTPRATTATIAAAVSSAANSRRVLMGAGSLASEASMRRAAKPSLSAA